MKQTVFWIVTMLLIGMPSARGSTPVPVEVSCPVCEEQFVYIWLGPISDLSVQTCPWCLFSATPRDLQTVHPDDVPAIRQALDDAGPSLVPWCRRAFGVELERLSDDRVWFYRVEQLLALICAEARRDLDPESAAMTRMLAGMGEKDERTALHLSRRLQDALEREIDDPIEIDEQFLTDQDERLAFRDRMLIERARELGALRIKHGSVEEGIAMLEQVQRMVKSWELTHGQKGFAWSGQVNMIAVYAQRAIDLADIRSWRVARLERVAAAFDPQARRWEEGNARGRAALAELARRNDAAAADVLARFARRSPDHLVLAASYGIIEPRKVVDHPELHEYLHD
ncbi:MAG: hypothetical protein ACYS0G_16520, partial [Planctomycetota bacterium]